jgi:hypothetical protein
VPARCSAPTTMPHTVSTIPIPTSIPANCGASTLACSRTLLSDMREHGGQRPPPLAEMCIGCARQKVSTMDRYRQLSSPPCKRQRSTACQARHPQSSPSRPTFPLPFQENPLQATGAGNAFQYLAPKNRTHPDSRQTRRLASCLQKSITKTAGPFRDALTQRSRNHPSACSRL